jgi:chromate transporter
MSTIPFREALRVWLRIGCLSFGGPAGQIALMHRILVEEKRWIGEARFLHALNYCMLLPGPEAQQLATYVGWLLHGTRGGLAAGLLFVLPGTLCVLALSALYAAYQRVPAVDALFFGLKCAVLAVVLEAVLRIGKRVLKNGLMVTIAALAFAAIFFGRVPFPVIVLLAGLVGLVGSRFAPERFPAVAHGARTDDGPLPEVDAMLADGRAGHVRASRQRAVRVLATWLVVWFAPLALAATVLGTGSVLVQEGLFFSKTAVVTFGGAYAVLGYVAQRAVETYGWLRPGEMLDGLGLAETTPGPLILVLQFVGFLAAYRAPGPFDPLVAGTLGAAMTVWVTFAPCFLWIFLGAPYVEALRGNRRLDAALSSVTAAVVGVVLNLALWFALHVLFGTVDERTWHGVRLYVPDLVSLDPAALVLAVLAALLLFRTRLGMVRTLAVSAALGLVWRLALG